MECSEPGAIRDEEFAAYLAGNEVRPEVAQHLAQCQSCSSQVAAYQRIDRQLANKLFRWDCPSSQVLGDYQLGLLSTTQASEVRAHLLFCLRCTAEVATLTEFLVNDPFLMEPALAARPAPNHHQPVREALNTLDQWREQVVEEARRIVAVLLSPQPRFGMQRDLAAQPALWPRNYTAGDVSISVQVEQAPHRRGSLHIIGLVRRAGAPLEALEGTPVRLISSNGVVATEQIDDLGNFVFSDVAPATCTLEVQFPESVVVVEQLPVELQE